jgi:N-acyl-L-homoserine lactone synthetase
MAPVAKSSYSARSSVSDQAAQGSFADRLALLLARTECRRADSAEQRDAIFRLRYQAYLREGAIDPNPSEAFTDSFDETGNVYIFGLHVDGELAGAIRLHIASTAHPEFPTGEVFPEQLLPEVEAGRVIVDVTRFVADWNLARVHRGLPYITLRIAWLAAEYFGGDHILAAVRLEHQAFYRRAFTFHLACGARPYPLLNKPVALMMLNFPAARDYMYRRYPFFHSTVSERRMLFERRPGRDLKRGPLDLAAASHS